MKTTTLALAAVSASTAAAQLNFHWPHTYRSIGGEASTPNPVSKSAAGWGFKWPHILRRDETCKPLSSIEDPVVGIDTGYIIGSAVEVEEESTIINRFLGIPFAKPPKRFERAEPAEPWASNLALKTQKYSPACVQQVLSGDSEINRAINGESENCLFLNVFQPTSEPPEGGFPVLFWIYGGSLEFGDAGQLFYEGSTLASEDVIVVTANYRTNSKFTYLEFIRPTTNTPSLRLPRLPRN